MRRIGERNDAGGGDFPIGFVKAVGEELLLVAGAADKHARVGVRELILNVRPAKILLE